MTPEDFVDLYGGDPIGRGVWVRNCPAHNDHSRSLSITKDFNGAVSLFCMRGCSEFDILDAFCLDWDEYIRWPIKPKLGDMSTKEFAEYTRKERKRQEAHRRACQRVFAAQRRDEKLIRQFESLPDNKVKQQMRNALVHSTWRLRHLEKLEMDLRAKY